MKEKPYSSAAGDSVGQQALWDDYWKSGTAVYTAHDEIVTRIEKYSAPGAVVMEIGAGLGVDILKISNRGRRAVAVDISKIALRQMRARHADCDGELHLVAADAMRLPFKSGAVDLAFHQGVMEHFRDTGPFLEEQRRILKSGGILIADVPQAFTWYTLRKRCAIRRGTWFAGWETQYSPGALRRLLTAAGFNVTEIYGRDYDVPLLRYISRIEKIGLNRYGRPIVPWIVRRPIGWACRRFENTKLSRYVRQCIGAVAVKR
jgi:ubiquinone/menaquinone biosynthesis C-methylase UbiE